MTKEYLFDYNTITEQLFVTGVRYICSIDMKCQCEYLQIPERKVMSMNSRRGDMNTNANNSISERRIRNNRHMRKLQLRRHIMISLLTVILVLGCSCLFFGFKSKAQGGDERIYCKYYKSVMVRSGDTIWDYADLYADREFYDSYESYINEVMNMNGLTDDHIQSGQYILLPYYSDVAVSG